MAIHGYERKHAVGRLRGDGLGQRRNVLPVVWRQPNGQHEHAGHRTRMDALSAFGIAVTTVALTGCGGCGGLLAPDDASTDALDDKVAPDVSGPVPMTCDPNGAQSDAAPFSPSVITCPLGWHCAAYHIAGPGNDTYCCPQGHGADLKYDPACSACPCDGPKCCAAGMQCQNTVTNVCDGG